MISLLMCVPDSYPPGILLIVELDKLNVVFVSNIINTLQVSNGSIAGSSRRIVIMIIIQGFRSRFYGRSIS